MLTFLGTYATHPNASSAKAELLSEFIVKMIGIGQLTKWSVALLGGGLGEGAPHRFPGGEPSTSYFIRKTEDPDDEEKIDPKHFAIGVLIDPKDEGIDLDDYAWRDALARTRAASKREPSNPPTFPSGKGIREARGKLGGEADRGLLLLYPLTPYFYKDKSKKPARLIVPGWDRC